MLHKKVIRIDDLCFDRKYFHSASLRVTEPPGGGTPDCYLVIVLFIDHGMKEYGVHNADLLETISQFENLLCRLGLPRLTVAETAQLHGEKSQEVRLRRAARASKAEAAGRASQEADVTAKASNESGQTEVAP